jgi:hypothetical protein
MNNKPVAWMCQDNVTEEWEFSSMKHCHKCEPLYTHPVKEQDESFDRTASHMAGEYVAYKLELTDEEIMEVATINLGHSMGLLNWMGFARAILRKAQEK